jgi:hypothetical protein
MDTVNTLSLSAQAIAEDLDIPQSEVEAIAYDMGFDFPCY